MTMCITIAASMFALLSRPFPILQVVPSKCDGGYHECKASLLSNASCPASHQIIYHFPIVNHLSKPKHHADLESEGRLVKML